MAFSFHVFFVVLLINVGEFFWCGCVGLSYVYKYEGCLSSSDNTTLGVVITDTITLLLEFEKDTSIEDLSWTITDDSGGTLLDSSDMNYTISGNYTGIEQYICIEEGSSSESSQCFELTFENSNDDSTIKTWFELYLNNISQTYNNEAQLWDNSKLSVYFCKDFLVSPNTGDNNDNMNNLTIAIDYYNLLEIANITNSDDEIIVYSNEIDNDDYDNNLITLYIKDGCYAITLSDDTSNNNNDDSDNDNNGISLTAHGDYTIYMNGYIIAQGGYYYDSDTNIVCTNKNHLSFCFIPLNCQNKDKIFLTKYEFEKNNDVMTVYSYQSLYNVIFDGFGTNLIENNSEIISAMDIETDVTDIDCYGSFSCSNTKIDNVYDIDCMSAFACYQATFNYDDSLSVTCYGFASCMNSIVYYPAGGIIVSSNIQTLNGVTIKLNCDDNPSFVVLARDPLSLLNDFILIEVSSSSNNAGTVKLSFELQSAFALYNGTIKCNNTNMNNDSRLEISFSCFSENQYFIIDSSCYDNNNSNNNSSKIEIDIGDGCGQLTSIEEINENTQIQNETKSLISKWIQLSNVVTSNAISELNSDSTTNTTLTYDIGHPLYASTAIENSYEYGDIFCRGYSSCAAVDTLKLSYGNLHCLGYQSCMDCGLIWNEDLDSSNTDKNTNDNNNNNSSNVNSVSIGEYDEGNIFCLGNYACSESILDASNVVFCGSISSCRNSVVLNAKLLICGALGCLNTILRNIDVMYIYAFQLDVVIYSGNIGTQYLYLEGRYSGGDLTYYCDEDDTCYIYCDMTDYDTSPACSVDGTILYCDGKCFVTCNYGNDNITYMENNITYTYGDSATDCVSFQTSLAPTMAPTESPSLAPTVSPTEGAKPLLTENDISSWLNAIVIIILSVSAFAIVAGIIDAKLLHSLKRTNDLLEPPAIVAFTFYTSDFISDVFFSLKLAVLSFEDDGSQYQDVYVVLFSFSLIFIIVPLITNISQLQSEIDKWNYDPILKHTAVSQWIQAKVRLLYFLSIICGSSFSAVALCNSYLFKLAVFSMGVSRYHKSIFRSKRFFSIVLFENVPQLIIQITTLILAINDDSHSDENSSFLITILSMLFTIISILVSGFEYTVNRNFLHYGSSHAIGVRFCFESKDIDKMDYDTFKQRIVFQQKVFRDNVAKLLHLNRRQLERLMPKRITNGAEFLLIIASDFENQDHTIETIKNKIICGELAKGIAKTYNLNENEVLITMNEKTFEIVDLDELEMIEQQKERRKKSSASNKGRNNKKSTQDNSQISKPTLTIADTTASNYSNTNMDDNQMNDISLVDMNKDGQKDQPPASLGRSVTAPIKPGWAE